MAIGDAETYALAAGVADADNVGEVVSDVAEPANPVPVYALVRPAAIVGRRVVGAVDDLFVAKDVGELVRFGTFCAGQVAVNHTGAGVVIATGEAGA